MNMKFEMIENEGLELIGIVKKIEMKKGAEQCPAFWKEFSEQLCIPMIFPIWSMSVLIIFGAQNHRWKRFTTTG